MEHSSYLHVAAIQMLPATGDCQANVRRATKLARQAVTEHGAELLVFPECTLTGYTSPGPGDDEMARHRRLAEEVSGPSVEHFAQLAAELHVYIVWGLHERCQGQFFNAAVLLSPQGKCLGTYRKVHINKYERQMGWTNGDQFFVWPCRVHQTTFKLGIMICFDREVPEAARCLAMLGADVIAVPLATSCPCNLPIHRDQLRVRAYENESYIAMANWAGPAFKGHSMLIDPHGQVLQLGEQEEKILFTVFDLQQLKQIRAAGIYGRHHRRPSAYGPLVDR